MPITVNCECGKTLKVDDKHRGKKAKCPACGNVLLVEESDADPDTGVQAEAPKKGRAGDDGVQAGKPQKSAAPDDDGDEPEERKPIKRPAKSNMMMYMIGGGCALVLLSTCCLSGVGAGVWWFFFRGVDDDLIYVHEGVLGFGSARVADGWKNAAFQDALKKMPGGRKELDDKIKEFEGKLGNKIDDVERATMIVRSIDFNNMADGPDMLFTVKTSRAMDKKKIIDTIVKESRAGDKEKEKEVKFDGGTIYTIGSGRNMVALYWPNDKVLLFSPKDESIKDAVKQAKKPAKHAAITRGLQAAQSGRHLFVMAFEVKKSWTDKIPPEITAKAPNAIKTTGVIITSTMSARESAFEAILIYENKDIAGKAKSDVDDGIGTMKMVLKGNKNAAMDKALSSIKVEQRGSEVVISGKSDLDVDAFGPINPFGGFGAGPGFEGNEVAVGAEPIGPMKAATRVTHINNMKQIGLAMHAFHDAHRALPNHAIRHPQTAQPLLSWRVAILPYIDQMPLYAQIKLDEPWDSPHNRQFGNKMPNIYKAPGQPNDGRTHLQVFHGDQSAFPLSKKPLQFNLQSEMTMVRITDGTSNTIMVVEAATPVNWMAPVDIPFQPGDTGLINRVGNYWGNNTFYAGFCDGTVISLRRTMTSQELQAFITPNGGETVVRPN